MEAAGDRPWGGNRRPPRPHPLAPRSTWERERCASGLLDAAVDTPHRAGALLAVERDHLVDRLAGLLELPGLLHLPARALVRDRERLPIPRAGDVQCARSARHRVRGRGHGGDLLEHGAGGILEAHERGGVRDVDERGQARAAAATATRFGARALRDRSAPVMAAPPAATTVAAAV